MTDNHQNTPQPARNGQPRVSIHETQFHRNTRDGTWRATCSCGWFHFGTQAEVHGLASVHDLEWMSPDVPLPAPAVAP